MIPCIVYYIIVNDSSIFHFKLRTRPNDEESWRLDRLAGDWIHASQHWLTKKNSYRGWRIRIQAICTWRKRIPAAGKRKDNPPRTQSVPAVLTLGQPRVNVKASGLEFVISKLLSLVNHAPTYPTSTAWDFPCNVWTSWQPKRDLATLQCSFFKMVRQDGG
jgi:hypothetical protein